MWIFYLYPARVNIFDLSHGTKNLFDRVNWNLSNRTEHNQWMHGWLASIFRIQTDVSRLMLLEQTQMRTSQEKTHLSYRYLCLCQLSKMWRELAKREREHTFHTIGFVKIILMLENVFDCMGIGQQNALGCKDICQIMIKETRRRWVSPSSLPLLGERWSSQVICRHT